VVNLADIGSWTRSISEAALHCKTRDGQSDRSPMCAARTTEEELICEKKNQKTFAPSLFRPDVYMRELAQSQTSKNSLFLF
jgi:hypothetical protein